MSRKSSSYRDSLLLALAEPAEAEAYLNAALEDSEASFLKAVRNVAQARGIASVAEQAGIQRETLYRSFSDQGNPTITTLSATLNALGMKLAITANTSSPGTAIPSESLVSESTALSK
jgi:probable addiction module antidote protein